MRAILFIWVAPVAFLVVWFVLAANDWNMGTIMFSRANYDLVLSLYANLLGIEPHSVPTMIAKIAAFDLALVAAFFGWRRWRNARRIGTLQPARS